MLRAVCALFDDERLLKQLRAMSEATEQLYDGSLSDASPYYKPLCEQLEELEAAEWRRACEVPSA